MRKSNNLNPILNKPKSPRSEPQKRKTRSNKLHDIKIPVSEDMDTLLRRESRRFWNGSKTAIGTEILLFGLENIFIYPDVTYKDSPFTVHCKVDHMTYQNIGNYASSWKCSVRQAAHRIFMEAIKKKQLGGIANGDV